jgi:predicted anti-sigma-YlaC factor YlaD
VDCQEVLDQLADYLDEDARLELSRQIEEHLSKCRNCQVEVDSVKKTIILFQADSRIEVPVRVTSRLQAALLSEYRANGTTGAPPARD